METETKKESKLREAYPLPAGYRSARAGEELQNGDKVLFFGFGDGARWLSVRPYHCGTPVREVDCEFYAKPEGGRA